MNAPTDHNPRRSPDGAHRDPTPDIASTAARVGAQPDAGHAPQRRSAARFSPKARARLQAARLWIAINRPYYCRALFACPLIPAPSQPTMAIAMDHQWRIFINPEFVACSTVEKIAAVLIHEINHALRSHAERGRRTAHPALVEFWKAACEFEINDDLEDDGLDVDDGLLPQRFGLHAGETAERYYKQLIDAAACVGAVPDCGPICAAHPDPGQHQLDARGTPGLNGLQRQLIRRATATAILAHAPNADEVPIGLHDWAEHTINAAVNWRQVLARALRHGLHNHTGASDYTWQRPARRQDPDDAVIRPAMAAPTASITVVLDTSGSMGQHEHDKAFAEINAILTKAVPGQAIRVLSVDEDVNTDQHITHARQITPAGGRGTDMAKGIQTAAETRPAVIIVITDGYTPWPETRPAGARTVIAALTHNWLLHQVPGWIQAIDISDSLN